MGGINCYVRARTSFLGVLLVPLWLVSLSRERESHGRAVAGWTGGYW
jgi:hypothetical protein